jgi:EipB-like
MNGWIRYLVLALWATGLFAAPARGAIMLVPHRAAYDVNLISAKSASGISLVKGEMLAEWIESCEGWSLDHRTLFDITYEQSGTIRITSSVATWESRDGLRYRFNITNAVNGRATEKFEGRARLAKNQGGGQADFVTPDRAPMKLAPGTVFPMTHTLRVLAATKIAPTLRTMTVFDGMSREAVFRISAVIGKPNAPAKTVMQGLKTRPSWPLQLAFFSVDGNEPEPVHEVGMRIYQNGVSDLMQLDFGEFKVRAKLTRLEFLERPVCDG